MDTIKKIIWRVIEIDAKELEHFLNITNLQPGKFTTFSSAPSKVTVVYVWSEE